MVHCSMTLKLTVMAYPVSLQQPQGIELCCLHVEIKS